MCERMLVICKPYFSASTSLLGQPQRFFISHDPILWCFFALLIFAAMFFICMEEAGMIEDEELDLRLNRPNLDDDDVYDETASTFAGLASIWFIVQAMLIVLVRCVNIVSICFSRIKYRNTDQRCPRVQKFRLDPAPPRSVLLSSRTGPSAEPAFFDRRANSGTTTIFDSWRGQTTDGFGHAPSGGLRTEPHENGSAV